MTTSLQRRCVFVFVALGIATAMIVALGQRDLLPLSFEALAMALVVPGALLRNLASHGELGFQDWRDTVLMTIGSAGTFTLVYAILDSTYRRLRRSKADSPVV